MTLSTEIGLTMLLLPILFFLNKIIADSFFLNKIIADSFNGYHRSSKRRHPPRYLRGGRWGVGTDYRAPTQADNGFKTTPKPH